MLAVSKGMPTRLRVVHPGGLNEQVFTLAGHPWQEEPFRNNSRDIGDNPASQAFGARDSLGANDQFNIVLNSAGGRKEVTGDYLYRSFIGTEFENGIWGVMRVGEPGSDIVAIARASNDKRGWGYSISGTTTVNPNNGKMAAEVTITAHVIAPNTKDPKPVSCVVPVHRVSGQWNTDTCAPAQQGVLVAGAGRPITVVSTERGRASINGFVPSVPPTPPSLEDIAAMVQQAKQKDLAPENKKELDQFRGEQTPQARVVAPPERPARIDPIVPTGRDKAPAGAGANDQGLVQPLTPPATVHPPDH